MPEIPAHWLGPILERLSAQDLDLALRHKILPVAWTPDHVSYGVASEHGAREAARRGLEVVAQIDRQVFHQGVFTGVASAVLSRAVHGLATRQPMASARLRLMPRQLASAFAVLAALTTVAIWSGTGTLLLLLSLACGLFFSLVVAVRLLVLFPAMTRDAAPVPPIATDQLPTYTVLVPLFRETTMLHQLVSSLLSLDYPVDKLDIKLILEQDDHAMITAVAALLLPDHFDVLVVPRGKPQTKPRALTYAMAFARGTCLTIYDCEDIPEGDQLRKAAAVFAAAGRDLACLQARLAFYNPGENWLTRQFAAEYAGLFHVILPGLADNGLPLPLGGTSNHFRTAALVAVGGWDPYNVTEDADLGYRLARAGYRTGMLHSTTFEEANTQFGNWMKQRRRWLKGFLHTWLVHMRQPGQTLSALGFDGFWTLQAMTIGVFMSALLHPFLLAYTAWFFLSGDAVDQAHNAWRLLAVGLSLAILVAGYASAIAASGRGFHRIGIRHCWGTLVGIPVYWMLMMPAAWLALWDFLARPHHWHKTRHGLSRRVQRRPKNRLDRALF